MKAYIFIFLFPLIVQAQSFPQILSCMSLINTKILFHEVRLNEYAMAQIDYQNQDWSFSVDVIENRLNSLVLENSKTQSKASTHSIDSGLRHLHLRLDTDGKYATVDCELKF